MHSQKTTRPSSQENLRNDGRPPNPGDATQDLITQMRMGNFEDILTEEDEQAAKEEEIALQAVRKSIPAREPSDRSDATGVISGEPPIRTPALPPVLQRIFGTEAEEELMAVAKFLDGRSKKKLTLVFHTSIGDVKCPINWCSHEPSRIQSSQDLLLIMVRSSSSMFAPNPGADLEISFAEHPGGKLKVTCLARPMQLYPGVGIDLLCFLPHTAAVEKTGKLQEDAPSVVSDLPSNTVDESGEPIVAGEKSASFADVRLGDKVENFDKPR